MYSDESDSSYFSFLTNIASSFETANCYSILIEDGWIGSESSESRRSSAFVIVPFLFNLALILRFLSF